MHENQISEQIIGAAIEVHRCMGPGLLESAYEECMAYEFHIRRIQVVRQKTVLLNYKGQKLDSKLRIDFLVAGKVVVELKAVEKIHPIHEAQVLTYLKLTNTKLGLLLNFNNELMRDGIQRVANGL